MTDQEALQEIVRYHNNINENNMSVIVDVNYTVICEDGLSAKLANTDTDHFVGRKIYPEIAKTAWRSEIVAKNLDDCLVLRKSSKWLSLRFSRNPEHWLTILTYSPLINRVTNNVIGYKIAGEPANFPLVFHNLDQIVMASHFDGITQPSEESPITLQEQAILFLLFNCDNYQEIAASLSLIYRKVISKSQVSKIIIRKLYPKFNVGNLAALKKVAYEAGYHKKIPLALFGEFMFPLNEL